MCVHTQRYKYFTDAYASLYICTWILDMFLAECILHLLLYRVLSMSIISLWQTRLTFANALTYLLKTNCENLIVCYSYHFNAFICINIKNISSFQDIKWSPPTSNQNWEHYINSYKSLLLSFKLILREWTELFLFLS